MVTKPVFLIVLFVMLAILALLLPLWSEPEGIQTSYSFAPSGHRAFYELAEQTRGQVRRWRRLPASLSGTGQALIMLEPQGSLLANVDASHQALVAWVKSGNDLILAPREWDVEVMEVMSQRFEVRTPSIDYLHEFSKLLAAFDFDNILFVTEPSETPNFLNDSFDQDLKDLLGRPGSSERLTDPEGVNAARRLVLQSPDGDINYEVIGAPRFMFHGESDFQTVFDAEGAPALVEANVGEGRLVFLLAPQWFRNKSIAAADHAAATLAMLAPYGPNGLLVDEFHHGLPAVDGWMTMMLRPPFLWLSLCSLLLIALVVWSGVFRTQPLQDPPAPSRRSKREHLDALGQLMAGAQNHAGIAARLQRGLENDMRSSLRLPGETPTDVAFDFLQRRNPSLAQEFSSVLREGEHLEHEPKRSSAWIAWGRRAHALRQRLNDE